MAWPCSVHAFFTYVIVGRPVFPSAGLEETDRERRRRRHEHSDVLPGGVILAVTLVQPYGVHGLYSPTRTCSQLEMELPLPCATIASCNICSRRYQAWQSSEKRHFMLPSKPVRKARSVSSPYDEYSGTGIKYTSALQVATAVLHKQGN